MDEITFKRRSVERELSNVKVQVMNSWKIGSFRPYWGLVLDDGPNSCSKEGKLSESSQINFQVKELRFFLDTLGSIYQFSLSIPSL